jgi:hypothetical protein
MERAGKICHVPIVNVDILRALFFVPSGIRNNISVVQLEANQRTVPDATRISKIINSRAEKRETERKVVNRYTHRHHLSPSKSP